MDPWAGIITGAAGVGKDWAIAAAFGVSKTAFIGGPGCFSAVETGLGLDTKGRVITVARPTLDELAEWAPAIAAKKFRNVVVSDVSIASLNTYMDLKVQYPGIKRIADRYEALKFAVQRFAMAYRAAGLLLAVNAHVRPGSFEKKSGDWRPGGPDLQGWQVLPLIPHAFDAALIMHRAAVWPWPAAFYAPGPYSNDWVTKDRYFVITRRPGHSGPGNLREYLRAAGVILPRDPGLDWQEGVADKVAALINDKGNTPREAWTAVADRLRGAYDLRHVRWAISDGIARAEYAKCDVLTPPPEFSAVGAGIQVQTQTALTADEDEE